MIDIFSISISIFELRNINNDEIVKYAKAKTIRHYNKETQDILSNDIFKDLNIIVEQRMNEYYSSIYNKKYRIKLQKSWANVSDDDKITIPHTHCGSILSAVYYPYAEEGEIIFLNPSVITDYQPLNDHIDIHNKYSSEYFVFPARTGHLVIFPSILQHMVRCKTDGDRISIAYNGELEKI